MCRRGRFADRPSRRRLRRQLWEHSARLRQSGCRDKERRGSRQPKCRLCRSDCVLLRGDSKRAPILILLDVSRPQERSRRLFYRAPRAITDCRPLLLPVVPPLSLKLNLSAVARDHGATHFRFADMSDHAYAFDFRNIFVA